MKVRRVLARAAERTGAQNGAVGSNLGPQGVPKSLSTRHKHMKPVLLKGKDFLKLSHFLRYPNLNSKPIISFSI